MPVADRGSAVASSGASQNGALLTQQGPRAFPTARKHRSGHRATPRCVSHRTVVQDWPEGRAIGGIRPRASPDSARQLALFRPRIA
ncbi:hypothetical protein D3C76_1136840 [compost metagenome]